MGYRPKDKTLRKNRTFRGRMISEDIYQVNMKVMAKGETPLVELIAGLTE